MCKQCGPLLEPIEERSEVKEVSEDKEGLDEEVGVACARSDQLNEVRGASKLVGSLRPEAPIFVPRVKFDGEAEVSEGHEPGTISVETDRLMGIADEVGLSVGPLTPEERAQPAKVIPQKNQSRSTARETEEVINVVSVEHL